VTGQRVNLRACEQRGDHRGEAELERGERSEPLRKVAAHPRHSRVHQTVQGGEQEVGLVAHAELLVREEVEVVKVERRRKGVEPLHDEIAVLELARGHWRV